MYGAEEMNSVCCPPWSASACPRARRVFPSAGELWSLRFDGAGVEREVWRGGARPVCMATRFSGGAVDCPQMLVHVWWIPRSLGTSMQYRCLLVDG